MLFFLYSGLLTATVSSEVFRAAQPALLYLVPFTLLPLVTMAYLKVSGAHGMKLLPLESDWQAAILNFLLFLSGRSSEDVEWTFSAVAAEAVHGRMMPLCFNALPTPSGSTLIKTSMDISNMNGTSFWMSSPLPHIFLLLVPSCSSVEALKTFHRRGISCHLPIISITGLDRERCHAVLDLNHTLG